MKYLKILGLAVIAAAAVMAFVGAGTASAETTLCKVTSDPCPAGQGYGVGTVTKGQLVAGTKAELTGGFNIRCEESTIEGSVETATTPTGNVAAANLKWGKCNGTVKTVTPGTIGVHHDGEHNGTLTVKDFVVTVELLGVHCYFRPEANAHGTLTAGDPALIHFTELPVELIDNEIHNSDGFGCPSTAKWDATYEVTSPTPLYVTTGA